MRNGSLCIVIGYSPFHVLSEVLKADEFPCIYVVVLESAILNEDFRKRWIEKETGRYKHVELLE